MTTGSAGGRTGRARFVCVVDARHFPGAVALVNSLRLAGHDEEIVFVDAGLDQPQRDLVAPHVTLARPPEGAPLYFLKYAPVELPGEVDVDIVVDADVIVTRSLEPLIASAAEGRLVAFADRSRRRFFPEWADILGLPALRR